MASDPRRGGFTKPARIVETKVLTGAAGGGAGGVVGGLLIWLLGVYVWGGPADAANAAYTASLVPSPVSGTVLLALALVGSFIGGYIGRHTERPDLTADDVDT